MMTFVTAPSIQMTAGELDFHAPVATYWPESPRRRRQGEGRSAPSGGHTAGLLGWDTPARLEDLPTGRGAPPPWPPRHPGGNRPGRHRLPRRQGYLIGEVVAPHHRRSRSAAIARRRWPSRRGRLPASTAWSPRTTVRSNVIPPCPSAPRTSGRPSGVPDQDVHEPAHRYLQHGLSRTAGVAPRIAANARACALGRRRAIDRRRQGPGPRRAPSARPRRRRSPRSKSRASTSASACRCTSAWATAWPKPGHAHRPAHCAGWQGGVVGDHRGPRDRADRLLRHEPDVPVHSATCGRRPSRPRPPPPFLRSAHFLRENSPRLRSPPSRRGTTNALPTTMAAAGRMAAEQFVAPTSGRRRHR